MADTSKEAHEKLEATPVWARDEVFPLKPEDTDYGAIDSKGGKHPVADIDELVEKVDSLRIAVDFVWTPDSDRLVVPEFVPELHRVLRKRQEKFALNAVSDGKRMSLVFGVAILWTSFSAWKNSGGNFHSVYTSQLTGLAALLLFIFGLLPLYESWKIRRRLANSKPEDITEEIPEAQFDVWLHRCPVPVTYFLLVCIVLIGVVQLYTDWGSGGIKPSILNAGLLKLQALNFPEIADGASYWRMFTAPLLHGNILHLIMNASGILYLGRRTESLARWPHLLIVFAFSGWMGSLASFYWLPEKMAVGASGSLSGLLGFMLVFEKIHPHLVPKPAQRRLLAGLLLMVIIGLLAISFIDNAAHAGGLFAGMIYAAVVFPKSASFRRPKAILQAKLLGGATVLVICGVTVWAACQVMDWV